VAKAKKRPFEVSDFLHSMDGGRSLKKYRTSQKVYAQGDRADSVFYVQEGKLKVFVMSARGTSSERAA
jgi:CRP/FNR family cyclic AMP-dependent transcriptional regulator